MKNTINVWAVDNLCILDKETKSENIENIWPSYCYRIKICILTNCTLICQLLSYTFFQDSGGLGQSNLRFYKFSQSGSELKASI